MAPEAFPNAKVTLSYPVWACDFDPQDPKCLVVGGGGGAGKSGVGNKITVLKTINSHELEEVTEIDLAKDEDNVQSLAVGQGKGSSTPIYAGINSSPKDLERGINEHFRVFTLGGQKGATSKISEQSRTALFSGKDKDAYQRILRLSAPFAGEPQLGAVATGLAQQPQIVLFETSTTTQAVSFRGLIEPSQDVEDIDVIQIGKDEYLVAYCSKERIYWKRVSPQTKKDQPELIYQTPGPENPQAPPPQSFRSIRFISPEFIIALVNINKQRGVVLQVLRLPNKDMASARIAGQAILPFNVKQATGFALCCLNPRVKPDERASTSEIVLAIAGHDTSIHIYTFDLVSATLVSIVAPMVPRKIIPSAHPVQITGLSFSSFTPPTEKSSKQVIKLASVSIGNTVVVHTISLKTSTENLAQSSKKTPRYVVDIAKESWSRGFLIFLTIFVLLSSILTQTVLEVRGNTKEYLGTSKYVSERVQRWIKPAPGVTSLFDDMVWLFKTPYEPPSEAQEQSSQTSRLSFSESLSSMLAKQTSNPNDHVIYIRENQDAAQHETDPELPASIKADLHNEAEHGPHGGMKWDEMGLAQQEYWGRKLRELGHNVEDFGTTILKGIVFGEIGGAIGNAAGGN